MKHLSCKKQKKKKKWEGISRMKCSEIIQRDREQLCVSQANKHCKHLKYLRRMEWNGKEINANSFYNIKRDENKWDQNRFIFAGIAFSTK